MKKYWFHEDENCSEAMAKQHNANAQTGEHKHKWRCFVEKSAYDHLLDEVARVRTELEQEQSKGDEASMYWSVLVDELEAENEMLKSSDHVRETFKSDEINRLLKEVDELKAEIKVLKLVWE